MNIRGGAGGRKQAVGSEPEAEEYLELLCPQKKELVEERAGGRESGWRKEEVRSRSE